MWTKFPAIVLEENGNVAKVRLAILSTESVLSQPWKFGVFHCSVPSKVRKWFRNDTDL